MKKNYIYKNQKGISLIVLIITIIIIFILAGTTINMIVGEGGVLFQSQETQNMQKEYINSQDGLVNVLIDNIDIQLQEDWKDTSGANNPKLSAEMIPVKWDGANWIVTNKKDSEWFDYTQKKWANVILKEDEVQIEGINDVQTATIEEMQGKKVTSLGSMFVWIPRYGYQIATNYHTNSETGGVINIKFLKDTTEIPTDGTKITWNNRNKQGNWNIHPAFEYNGAVEGIWVSKFEASSMEENQSSNGGGNTTEQTIQIKPGVNSWRGININNIYTNCLNYDTKTIGNSNLNSHLIKNSEWGAVVYLAKSVYGKNSKIETNSGIITGGGNGDAYITNVAQSTTGTIYGIYDMCGGSDEFVAAYINNTYTQENGTYDTTEYAESLIAGETYTKDVYTIGTTDSRADNYAVAIDKYGDAIYEISNSGDSNTGAWFNESSYFSYSLYPFFKRGGSYMNSNVGIINFDSSIGNVEESDTDVNGFRICLCIK